MANENAVPLKWILIFLVLALGVGVLTVLFLGGSLIGSAA